LFNTLFKINLEVIYNQLIINIIAPLFASAERGEGGVSTCKQKSRDGGRGVSICEIEMYLI